MKPKYTEKQIRSMVKQAKDMRRKADKLLNQLDSEADRLDNRLYNLNYEDIYDVRVLTSKQKVEQKRLQKIADLIEKLTQFDQHQRQY